MSKRTPGQDRHVGKNVTMKVKGKHLFIRVDISKNYGASSTGKTECVASTRGNVRVPGREDMKIGVNVFKALNGTHFERYQPKAAAAE